MLQTRREFIFKEDSRDSHPNAAKRRAIQLERNAHVVDCGRVVNQLELLPEICVHYTLEIGAVGNRFAIQVRIGVQNRNTGIIYDGSVVDDRHTAHNRIHHCVQITIGAQIVDHGPAHRLRVIGVHTRAGQVWGRVRCQIRELRIQVSGVLMRGGHSLPQ